MFCCCCCYSVRCFHVVDVFCFVFVAVFLVLFCCCCCGVAYFHVFCLMFVLMYYIVKFSIVCYYAFCSMYDFVLVCFSRFLRNQVTRKGSKLKR
jgi:hypothetical protein